MDLFILNQGGDPTEACDYKAVDCMPECCGSNSICAIKTCGDEHGHPVINNVIQEEMINALNNGADTQHVHLKFC